MPESSRAAPGGIFMSYRSEETALIAELLYEKLTDHFGGGPAFKHIDSSQHGQDFAGSIAAAVGSCDVLLVLISDRWLTITDADGRRCIDDPDDFMRLEIEAALARNIRVVPILVDGARMPRAEDLPPSLAGLARRQALVLNPGRFTSAFDQLLSVLDRSLAEVQASPALQEPRMTDVAKAAEARPARQAEQRHPGRNYQLTGEAPPGRDRGHAKRRRSQAEQPDDAVTRAVRAAVKPGVLTFNPPAEMIQGQWERVEVGIARSLELRKALAAGLRGRGEPQFERINTSPFMSVELSGPSFEVVSFGPTEQLVPEIARWEFDVRPYRAGHQTLTLCVSLRVDSPITTGGRIAVPVLKREIRIRVDVGFSVRRFLAKNWQWLIATTLGLGGALATWVTLFR